MNMVGHHFQCLCDRIDDLLRSLVHAIDRHLASILRTKDPMLFAGIQNVAIASFVQAFQVYDHELWDVKIGG